MKRTVTALVAVSLVLAVALIRGGTVRVVNDLDVYVTWGASK